LKKLTIKKKLIVTSPNKMHKLFQNVLFQTSQLNTNSCKFHVFLVREVLKQLVRGDGDGNSHCYDKMTPVWCRSIKQFESYRTFYVLCMEAMEHGAREVT
jgi:hypothetical protein